MPTDLEALLGDDEMTVPFAASGEAIAFWALELLLWLKASMSGFTVAIMVGSLAKSSGFDKREENKSIGGDC